MTNLLTPVGRIVQGSLYEPQTKDALGNPLIVKNGVQAGSPRQDFYFALAILKNNETHWSQTEWGKIIWEVGQIAFPNGQALSPTFAWKIIDGDSAMPNKIGKKPCENPGFPGCWILKFSSGFAPTICNSDGTQRLLEINHVNLGDFIQVAGTVNGNDSMQQPGVYLNHTAVAFAGYGERIILGIDTKNIGFGQSDLPPGVSQVPLSKNTISNIPPTLSLNSVLPYPGILTATAPVGMVGLSGGVAAPLRLMLPKANGVSYEQYKQLGWTDEALIQHGMMTP